MIVIRIKNLDNISRQIGLLYCLLVITLVKGIQTKAVHRLCIPDSEGVDNAVAISYYWKIIGNCLDRLVILLIPDQSAVLFPASHVSTKFDHLRVLCAAQLKRIAVSEPVIGNFALESVADLLLKHSVAVADTASVCRVSKRRKRV